MELKWFERTESDKVLEAINKIVRNKLRYLFIINSAVIGSVLYGQAIFHLPVNIKEDLALLQTA